MANEGEVTPVGTEEIDAQNILDELEKPDEPEVLDLKDKKDEDDEEEKEEKEEKTPEEGIEEDLKEPTENDLELMTPVRRREILAKYPKLFKDFPYIERAYFRDQKFSEIYATPAEAEEAKSKAETLDNLETTVMQDGDIGAIFKLAKEDNPESFNKIVDNMMQGLKNADEGAFFHVVGNITKATIMQMVEEAEAMGEQGQPLKAAATILNQFVFGSQKFTPPARLSKVEEKNDKEKELESERQQLLNEKYESVRDDLQGRVDSVIRATIDTNIDPRKSMSDYVRRNATRDAFENLEKMLKEDTRFRALLDKLWEASAKTKFNKLTVDAIKSAYVSKAKSLLPTVIKQARIEALRGNGKKESETPVRKSPITPGRSTPPRSSGKSSEIPKGMKTLDYLNQD